MHNNNYFYGDSCHYMAQAKFFEPKPATQDKLPHVYNYYTINTKSRYNPFNNIYLKRNW